MKQVISLLFGLFLVFAAQSQCGSCVLNTCPANEGDLANGGTFCTSGTCNVSTGGNNSASLNGKVIWCSGILNLTGSPGDIFVNDTILILGGTIQIQDNNDGALDINSGAYVFIANGATLSVDDEIDVNSGGTLIIEGDLTTDSDIFIDDGSSVTINSTGHMSTTGADDDIFVDGNLTVIGGEVDAFTMTVGTTGTLNSNGADFDLDEDLIIDGTWTDTNSVVIVGNDLQINGTATSTGTSFTVADDFEVDGNFTSSGITLNVTDDINLDGTWVDINSTIDSDDDFNVNGSFTSTGSNIDFADNMDVNGGGSVNLTNVNLDVDGDIDIAGSLTTSGGTIDANQITSSGTVTTSSVITLVDDLEVDGGTFNLLSPGSLDVGDDLKVYNGGTFNQYSGSSVNVTNNVVNSDNGGGGGNTTGTFNICDRLTVGGNLTIANTTPNSSLCGCGTGVLAITGTFSHTETPQCDFFGCAGGGVPCTHSVLPVTWLGFSHALNGDDVQLFWSTASEKNNLGFDVQRANNDLEFQSLGFVDGHGNSNQLRQYEFHDENLKPGTYFYRLVQTDIDQKRDHSEILAVELGGPAADYVIYPNPSKDVFHLNFPGEELNEIRIQDLMGRTVNVEVSRDAAGIYTLHTGSLVHGLYFVELNSASGVSRTQLIKE